MTFEDDLLSQTIDRVIVHPSARVAIVGYTSAGLYVRSRLLGLFPARQFAGVFDPAIPNGNENGLSRWSEITSTQIDVVVIAADAEKEELIEAILPAFAKQTLIPDLVLGGIDHLKFRDAIYDLMDRPALVPSYATGYVNTRVHLYQCLKAAAKNNLRGAVVEFGSFKGGTTAWLARVVDYLGVDARVIGFDTWSGFPPKRSSLDLYTHDRCVFSDEVAVRAYLEPLGVELVAGDIVDTAPVRLAAEPILLAFVDTDNYSPAKAALSSILPNLVVGGSIVFDHYETTEDYIYTLGERLAAKEMLVDSDLLQLHGTGVFVKIA